MDPTVQKKNIINRDMRHGYDYQTPQKVSLTPIKSEKAT